MLWWQLENSSEEEQEELDEEDIFEDGGRGSLTSSVEAKSFASNCADGWALSTATGSCYHNGKRVDWSWPSPSATPVSHDRWNLGHTFRRVPAIFVAGRSLLTATLSAFFSTRTRGR